MERVICASMAELPAWRRTGRSAQAGHYDVLGANVWIEFPGYDDSGRQQGTVLAYFVESGRGTHDK